MSTINASPCVRLPSDAVSNIRPDRVVIAAVVEWRGRIALFRRSRSLGHDSGRWHCITGYVEAGATPEQQALEELFEETGLHATDLLDLRPGPDLMVPDRSGTLWLVHTFTALTSQRRLRIDWEHDSYRWTAPHKAKRFANRVSWLDNVLEATGHYPATLRGRQPRAATTIPNLPDQRVSP
ncbi:NUDIX domain-containing protein [Arthrobacter sp. I2-34]|uniref:NUDIX domain-containing protein n=1 Tax=Arthrobacter hankyongi TaxID=2904801 RepID=A0ABS9LE63_9MICC|nr:NUDIX domain-containing protein [Arthrobacter hankyongi]MCG2624727.1 NUDIX domain-containing protein [Arthrobacter hankyongi]